LNVKNIFKGSLVIIGLFLWFTYFTDVFLWWHCNHWV